VVAMTAARLGEREAAIQALLMPKEKDTQPAYGRHRLPQHALARHMSRVRPQKHSIFSRVLTLSRLENPLSRMCCVMAARKSVAVKTSKLRLILALRRERQMTVSAGDSSVIFSREKGLRRMY